MVTANRSDMDSRLGDLLKTPDLPSLRREVSALEGSLLGQGGGKKDKIASRETVVLRRDILIDELEQVRQSHTLERARHYLERFREGLQGPRFAAASAINLRRWKEFDDVWTDSLWIVGKRDSSGAHIGSYWGNFVPQIPHQMMLRYTRPGEWVLDAFAGSGTTLIECRRLGRNGIGIELSAKVAEDARELVAREPNPHRVRTELVVGDSSKFDLRPLLRRLGAREVGLLIMHPPYHDIIRFSDEPADLSNAADVEAFLNRFSACVDNVAPFLGRGRYLALVIGDKYSKGEWVPLGFKAMERVLATADFVLKSIVVKNFDETRGKRNQKELWRYRALSGGFYVFKHEYIFVFRKKGAK